MCRLVRMGSHIIQNGRMDKYIEGRSNRQQNHHIPARRYATTSQVLLRISARIYRYAAERRRITMMTLRQQLCDLFCNHKEEPAPPFSTLRHRSGLHVRQKLQSQFPNAHIRIADSDYSAPTKKEFEAWLKTDPLNLKIYHPEWHDCDDFARAIRCKTFRIGQHYKTPLTIAYCEGYTEGSYHAYNLLIDNKDAIYIIEPQNDRCVPAENSTYRTDFIQL